ncbi:MAG: VanZ family protein [Candidatus Fermentibacteraceae bacterium]|nr:VanZ family protein [Candidatus Fermentibacteraceae bacterium]
MTRNNSFMAVIFRRGFLILVSFLVVYLSHQPSLKPPLELFPHQDKLFHMIEFGGLGLALVLNRDIFGTERPRTFMLVSGAIWAVLDELHQSFVPGRDSSLQDVAADAAGLVIAVLIFFRLFQNRTPHTDSRKTQG